jgi:hypothetical protein
MTAAAFQNKKLLSKNSSLREHSRKHDAIKVLRWGQV